MALRYIATGEVWRGAPIADTSHPRNIETLWSAQELAAIGLELAPEPAPVPADPNAVPKAVTMVQARIALRATGLLDRVNAAVAAADDNTKDGWEYSTVLRRNSPTLVAIAGTIGLSEAQVDELFLAAAQVTL
jgi:hypothetical protein